mmetsp:Transcript_4262/g.14192  ORF Transcript_4262/g.14192 Transcript_4262/m.14192 type:complete len:257 (-) Transcript_4262:5199-5969(-)
MSSLVSPISTTETEPLVRAKQTRRPHGDADPRTISFFSSSSPSLSPFHSSRLLEPDPQSKTLPTPSSVHVTSEDNPEGNELTLMWRTGVGCACASARATPVDKHTLHAEPALVVHVTKPASALLGLVCEFPDVETDLVCEFPSFDTLALTTAPSKTSSPCSDQFEAMSCGFAWRSFPCDCSRAPFRRKTLARTAEPTKRPSGSLRVEPSPPKPPKPPNAQSAVTASPWGNKFESVSGSAPAYPARSTRKVNRATKS